MPYVTCPRCGLRSFSAAYRFSRDHCAGCGSELPRPPARAPDAFMRQRRFAGPFAASAREGERRAGPER
jgi:hypothetical protein